jgi:hypothetical protein
VAVSGLLFHSKKNKKGDSDLSPAMKIKKKYIKVMNPVILSLFM